MTLEVVGRDVELAAVREALAQVETGATAAVVEGELGIGKTTLWLAGIDTAENEGFRVLVSRPVEAESQLSYAGLGDLLASVPDGVLDELPTPQRRALEVALHRAAAEKEAPDQAAIAFGFLGALRALSRDEDRLSGLPADCEAALLFAAAASQPSVALLEAAMEAEVSTTLEPALEAELIELEGERIRFAHPLLASTVYAKAGADRKRGVHRRLAEVVVDREERARHLALGTEQPDAQVAAALDDAARSALGRGAPQSAAGLSEQALRLTPTEDSDAAHRRRLEAGGAHFEAGDTGRAHELFAEATDRALGGVRQAEALCRLARLQVFEGGRRAAAELFERALAEAGDDLELRSEAEEGLAVSYYMLRENLAAAALHAHSAVESARQLGRPRALAEALSGQGLVEGLLGRPSVKSTFEEALELEQATESLRVMRRPSYSHAVYLTWTDDLELARDQFEGLYRRALDRGDESSIPRLLTHLSGV